MTMTNNKCKFDSMIEQAKAIQSMQRRLVPGVEAHEQDLQLVRAITTATHVLLDTIGSMTDNDWSARLPNENFATMMAEGVMTTLHDANCLQSMSQDAFSQMIEKLSRQFIRDHHMANEPEENGDHG